MFLLIYLFAIFIYLLFVSTIYYPILGTGGSEGGKKYSRQLYIFFHVNETRYY